MLSNFCNKFLVYMLFDKSGSRFMMMICYLHDLRSCCVVYL